jgi:hypothetical protein
MAIRCVPGSDKSADWVKRECLPRRRAADDLGRLRSPQRLRIASRTVEDSGSPTHARLGRFALHPMPRLQRLEHSGSSPLF